MHVDVRWIVLVLVGGGAIVLVTLLPAALAPITGGVGVIGLLYVVLRLGGGAPEDGTPDSGGQQQP